MGAARARSATARSRGLRGDADPPTCGWESGMPRARTGLTKDLSGEKKPTEAEPPEDAGPWKLCGRCHPPLTTQGGALPATLVCRALRPG